MVIQFIAFIGLFITQIFALQFGFRVRDVANSFSERFVAFGIIPDSSSSKIQAEIVDQLTTYIDAELHRRSLEGIERTSFVSEPTTLSALKDGRVLTGLKGELSVFLNLFRFSCKYVVPIQNTWKDAVFFNDPIMILNFDEINKFMTDFDVLLISPAFDEEDESIYADIFRRFTSSNASDNERTSLLSGEDKQEEKEKKCCTECNCNIM